VRVRANHLKVGLRLTLALGLGVGAPGLKVGRLVGVLAVGLLEGLGVGEPGLKVGLRVGAPGLNVGLLEGLGVGEPGLKVGLGVGAPGLKVGLKVIHLPFIVNMPGNDVRVEREKTLGLGSALLLKVIRECGRKRKYLTHTVGWV
jgi:hypothetical protein